MAVVDGMLKCTSYNAFSKNCNNCDISIKPRCGRSIDFDEPQPFVAMKRCGLFNAFWHECPTCGAPIGYYPDDNNYKCAQCNQRISQKSVKLV